LIIKRKKKETGTFFDQIGKNYFCVIKNLDPEPDPYLELDPYIAKKAGSGSLYRIYGSNTLHKAIKNGKSCS